MVTVPPTISVIIPCYNEARRLEATLTELARQTLQPVEVLLVDGRSTDGSPIVARDVARRLALPLRVLDNPARHIPHALNLGIAAAVGTHIARLDGHAHPHPDYLAACWQVAAESGADLVGGVVEIVPDGLNATAAAVALAVSTPLGTGGSAYRSLAAPAQDVDTVPFGFFTRALWTRLGGFDETLLTNEDYEFAYRLRAAGGRVRFDPRIRSVYVARPDFAALVRQYWRYGWWKSQMLRRHPESLRPRQALPILWAAGTLGALAAGALSPAWRGTAAAGLGAYAVALLLEAGRRAGWARPTVWPRLALAYALIHYTWGFGALAGAIAGGRARHKGA